MIELLESYSQKIERKAIMETMNYKILPKTFKRFVDYSQAHFQHFKERKQADKFSEILNKQDSAIKYTVNLKITHVRQIFCTLTSPTILLTKNTNLKYISNQKHRY